MACDKTALEIIAIRAPRYISDPIKQRLVDMIELSECKTGAEFGKCFQEAVALRVLHWLTKQGISDSDDLENGVSGNESVGVVTSVKEGDDSISYGGSATSGSSPSSKYGDLSTTSWGQELIELMRGCLFLPRTRLI